MGKKPQNIEQRVLALMSKAKRGELFFPEQFSNIGESTAIRKALQRLVQKGSIVRVAQGMYVIPMENNLVGRVLPGATEIAIAISKRDHVRIVPTGVQALNMLGLSTQVPMKIVYLTDGASRIVKVGKQTIRFKYTAPKILNVKGELSSLVIQALKTIGKDKATPDEIQKLIGFLKKEKPEVLLHDMKLAPAWIIKIMKLAL